jgi:sugar O-acyltransferase (sialic acid O-acetyltransferase NeuD family)
MKENIAIFGAGTMANTYIDTIESQNIYNIVGFFDDKYPELNKYGEYPVIGNGETFVDKCKKFDINNIAVCIGDNYVRELVVNKIRKLNPDIKFPVLIDKQAYVSPRAIVGEGTCIFAHSTVNGGVEIDGFSFMGPNTTLAHGCKIGLYSSFAPGVTLAGEVVVERLSFIGIGSQISHGINIGSNVIVGAGSTVLKDIQDNVVAYGTPAKVAHTREVGEKYL